MKYGRIIMFCDYGLDDAIATLHILRNAGMFGRIDIVPVGGNVPVDIAYPNAHTLLAAADADINKVRIVDTRGIAQAAADIPDVHGKDGIGDVLSLAPSNAPVIAFDEYKNELAKNGDPSVDCLLSLGPCTVPVLLGYMPETIVVMGGTTLEPPNQGDYEFNECMDIAAFETLAARATAVATLDSCHDKKFDFDNMRFDDALADKLLKKYVAMCKRRNAFVTVYDYVAALFVTDPALFAVHKTMRADGVEYNEIKLKRK